MNSLLITRNPKTKQTMKKSALTLVTLCCLISVSLKSQLSSYITAINTTVATIPYIFEGKIQSVEIYAGDDVGNKLPWSAAVWNGDIGYFYDASGNEAKGFSLTKISVCKVYKGDILREQGVTVLTKSFAINNVYLRRIGSGADADTVLEFLNTPASHPEGENPLMLPRISYPKKIYFCDRIDMINPTDYAGKEYNSNFHSLLEMPFNQPIYIPQPDGSTLYKVAYCAIVPYAFDDQTQLQLFLNQINTINPNPDNWCSDDGTKQAVSVKEVGTNPFNISVFPNPSAAGESVKVKFSLTQESPVNLILTDISGKQIVNTHLRSQKNIEYDLNADVQSGIYFLQVNFGQNKQTFKITKN
jgi:hypothetical protein